MATEDPTPEASSAAASSPAAPPARSAASARLRPGRALARVFAAPGFILALWILQLLTAKTLANISRTAGVASLDGGGWIGDGHRLRALAELMVQSPALAATMATTISAAALAAMVFSIVAAPAILTRLAGGRSLAEIFAAAGRHLPAMIVQTIYGLVFRAVCTGLAIVPLVAAGADAMASLPLIVVVAAFPVLVLDRARAAVVLEGERPYHPMTFLRAIVRVARRPTWWVVGALVDLLKVAVGLAALIVVLRAEVAGGLWIARGAGLLALGFGLWRVALAVEDAASGRPRAQA